MYLLNLLTQLVTSQLLLNQQFIFRTFLRITSELKEIVYYSKRPISLLFHALSHKTIKSHGKFYCQYPLTIFSFCGIDLVDLGERICHFGKIGTPTSKHGTIDGTVSSSATHSVALHVTKVFQCLKVFSKPQAFNMTLSGPTLSDYFKWTVVPV